MKRKRSMRILVLMSDAFGGVGGIAKFNRDLLTALCAYPDCTEVVAIPRLMPTSSGPLPMKLTYVTRGLNGKLKYIAAVFKTVRRNPEFNLVICGHINLLPIAYLFRFWIQAPIFLVIHGIDAWEPTRSRLTNYLARKLDAFISVSELTGQRFLRWAKLSGNKGFLLSNTIDLDRFTPGPKNPALLERYGLAGKTVLLTGGRLAAHERYKGFDEVMELLPALAKEIPNIAYLIVGDGTDRQRLEGKTQALGVAHLVRFAGFISESEKADHYRLADVFVMPGRGEGFGIVYLEAMACGVPVVASKVDGSREAVRDGALGILVDPNDPEEIKMGIFEALKRPKGVVPEGLDYFSYENFERRLHRIIDQVLGSNTEGKTKL